jgi:hypothetical protein
MSHQDAGTMTGMECMVCGDVVSLTAIDRATACTCGSAYAAISDGLLTLYGKARAVWIDASGVVWEPSIRSEGEGRTGRAPVARVGSRRGEATQTRSAGDDLSPDRVPDPP